MHCEKMVDCRYSQVEIVLLKLSCSTSGPRAGQTNALSDPLVEKKSCATREKHLFYSCGYYPRFARASNFTLAK